uniref:AlNc14C123G6742 protein n=1 Tax=Albugo laibachii Nc14 TaxID=890382 RepID=F0WJL7_9STRA|nr:AlNc14C123G6742 [Albugo laibachii Nc14]|eukprot:CCA21466.1 AlNc14C123G6742 [Albugo laibachii Nc14]
MSRSTCDDESVDWRVIEPSTELNIEELFDVEIDKILPISELRATEPTPCQNRAQNMSERHSPTFAFASNQELASTSIMIPVAIADSSGILHESGPHNGQVVHTANRVDYFSFRNEDHLLGNIEHRFTSFQNASLNNEFSEALASDALSPDDFIKRDSSLPQVHNESPCYVKGLGGEDHPSPWPPSSWTPTNIEPRHPLQDTAFYLEEIERMRRKMLQQDTNLQEMQNLDSDLRSRHGLLEQRYQQLSTETEEMQRSFERNAVEVRQKSDEISMLRDKVYHLQAGNESLQEDMQNANCLRDKVTKDYHQLVFELGKAQNELNALATKRNEHTSTLSKKCDELEDKIAALRQENQLLSTRLRNHDQESHASASQATALMDAQNKIKALKQRIFDLELASTTSSTTSYPFSARNKAVTPPKLRQAEDVYAKSDKLNGRYITTPMHHSYNDLDKLQDSSSFNHDSEGAMSYDAFKQPSRHYTSREWKPSIRSEVYSSHQVSPKYQGVRHEPTWSHQAPLLNPSSEYEQLRLQLAMRNHSHGVDRSPASLVRQSPTTIEDSTSMMQYHMLQKEPVERALLKLEMEKEGVTEKLSRLEQGGCRVITARKEKHQLQRRLRQLEVEIGRLCQDLSAVSIKANVARILPAGEDWTP